MISLPEFASSRGSFRLGLRDKPLRGEVARLDIIALLRAASGDGEEGVLQIRCPAVFTSDTRQRSAVGLGRPWGAITGLFLMGPERKKGLFNFVFADQSLYEGGTYSFHLSDMINSDAKAVSQFKVQPLPDELPGFWMTIEEVLQCGGFFVGPNDDIPFRGSAKTSQELFSRSATAKLGANRQLVSAAKKRKYAAERARGVVHRYSFSLPVSVGGPSMFLPPELTFDRSIHTHELFCRRLSPEKTKNLEECTYPAKKGIFFRFSNEACSNKRMAALKGVYNLLAQGIEREPLPLWREF
jgi:hypothetical protein